MHCAIGFRSDLPFEDIIEHIVSFGGDCILLEPSMVCGCEHILSAADHAERAFSAGRNRSKTKLTETILYAACERQIGKAMGKMKPKGNGYVACLFDTDPDVLNSDIIQRDDSLMDASVEKAKALGIDVDERFPIMPQVLEAIAFVDLMKQ